MKILKQIKRERFEALVGYSRLPHAAAFSREVDWYSNNDGWLLATIVFDFSDEDYVVIILGRDLDNRFRAIDTLASYDSIKAAHEALQNKVSEINLKEVRVFPQGDEKGKKKDIFQPLYDTNKLHPSFEILRNSNGYSSAKEIIAEAMHHYTDIDGNFIEQFQTTGFDSRLWELYLFAYLTEEYLLIDRTNNAPDFIVSNGEQVVAVEAVTVQHSQNNIENENIDFTKLTPADIQELQKNYMPIKFGSPLFSKLKKKYWELEQVKGKPLVFAIADFHAKQSMLWSSTALHNYLYGTRHDFHFDEDGKLVISPIKIEYHEHNGKKIPSGFFFTEDAENISAVMFSASGTISKFVRMGKLAGFGDTSVRVFYQGTCHKHDPDASMPNGFHFEVNEDYSESWASGISIFHNPHALIPLSQDVFPSAAHHWMLPDGNIESILPEFHPYNGRTIMVNTKTDE